MRRNKAKKLAVTSLLSMCALILVSTLMVSNVSAAVFPKSSNVALVPDRYCSHGGRLPISGFPNGDTFTFTDMQPSVIADGTIADPLAAYDTVMLMTSDFSFGYYWGDSDFSSRITNFVANGGKLIIYDSESQTSDFSTFIYPFAASTPGAMGASTPVTIVDDNTLSSNNAADASYVNIALLTSTDAGGDANSMVTYNSNWYLDMAATNILNVYGPVHTYALYGDGLIIYNGLDIDYASTAVNNLSGSGVLGMIWYLELCGHDLGPGISVSGLTLSPKTATNYLGETHTVTALVTDSVGTPVPDITVDFEITAGPNMALSGSGVSDENGLVTFEWSSSVAGIDTVTATMATATGQAVSDTATKTWIDEIDNVIPEVPLGTIAIAITMLFGFTVYHRRSKVHKTTTP